MSNKKHNKLYYYGTEIEILHGDNIQLTSFFLRTKKMGRVSYIPKLTGVELAKQRKHSDDWLIELEDKTVTGWTYVPEEVQPIKRLKFISRGNDDYKGITSNELEKLEEKILGYELEKNK